MTRKLGDYPRYCMELCLILFVITLPITSVHGTVTDQSCQGSLPEMPLDITKETTDQSELTQKDLSSCEAYDQLIEVLEKLSILTPRTTSCYSFKSVIRKSSAGSADQNQRNVLITLKFVENFVHSFDNVNSSGSAQDQDYSLTKTSCQNSGASINTVKRPMSMQHSNNESESNYNVSSTLPTKQSSESDDHEGGGLSHTQVVVIATCSAVIGTFFIVAAVMRIRNYVKRMREEQMSARRTNYRLPLQSSSHNTPKQSRQSSLNSKSSAQNSPGAKRDALYLQVSNGMSAAQNPTSKVTYLDTNPMLVITAPSTVPNTPSDSHASIQFIDEDATDKGSSVATTPEDDTEAEKKPLIQKEKSDVSNVENRNLFEEEKKLGASPSSCNSPVEKSEETPNKTDDETTDSNSVSIVSPTEEESIGNICSVNSGITQSDESLNSDSNPSYCYGNQAEYSCNSGYGNVAYYPNGFGLEYECMEQGDIENECLDSNHSNSSDAPIENQSEQEQSVSAIDNSSSLDNKCNDVANDNKVNTGAKTVTKIGQELNKVPLDGDLITNCSNSMFESPVA